MQLVPQEFSDHNVAKITQALLDSAYLEAFSQVCQGQKRTQPSSNKQGEDAGPLRRSVLARHKQSNIVIQQDQQEEQHIEIEHADTTPVLDGPSFSEQDLAAGRIPNQESYDEKIADTRVRNKGLLRERDLEGSVLYPSTYTCWRTLFKLHSNDYVDRIHISALDHAIEHMAYFQNGINPHNLPQGFAVLKIPPSKHAKPENILVYSPAHQRTRISPYTVALSDIENPVIPWKKKQYAFEQTTGTIHHKKITVDSAPESVLKAQYGENVFQQYQLIKNQLTEACPALYDLLETTRNLSQFSKQATIDSLQRVLSFNLHPFHKKNTQRRIFNELVAHQLNGENIAPVIHAFEAFWATLEALDLSFPVKGFTLKTEKGVHLPTLLDQIVYILQNTQADEQEFVWHQLLGEAEEPCIRPEAIRGFYWLKERYHYNLVMKGFRLSFFTSDISDAILGPIKPTVPDFFNPSNASLHLGPSLFLRYLAAHNTRVPIAYYEMGLLAAWKGITPHTLDKETRNFQKDLAEDVLTDYSEKEKASYLAQQLAQFRQKELYAHYQSNIPNKNTPNDNNNTYYQQHLFLGIIAAASEHGQVSADLPISLPQLWRWIHNHLSSQRASQAALNFIKYFALNNPSFSVEQALLLLRFSVSMQETRTETRYTFMPSAIENIPAFKKNLLTFFQYDNRAAEATLSHFLNGQDHCRPDAFSFFVNVVQKRSEHPYLTAYAGSLATANTILPSYSEDYASFKHKIGKLKNPSSKSMLLSAFSSVDRPKIAASPMSYPARSTQLDKIIYALNASPSASSLSDVNTLLSEGFSVILRTKKQTRIYWRIVEDVYNAFTNKNLFQKETLTTPQEKEDRLIKYFNGETIIPQEHEVPGPSQPTSLFERFKKGVQDIGQSVTRGVKNKGVNLLLKPITIKNLKAELQEDARKNKFPKSLQTKFISFVAEAVNNNPNDIAVLTVSDELLNFYSTLVYLNHKDPLLFSMLFSAWHNKRNKMDLTQAKTLLFLSMQSAHPLIVFNTMANTVIDPAVLDLLSRQSQFLYSASNPLVLEKLLKAVKHKEERLLNNATEAFALLSTLPLSTEDKNNFLATFLDAHVEASQVQQHRLIDFFVEQQLNDPTALFHGLTLSAHDGELIKKLLDENSPDRALLLIKLLAKVAIHEGIVDKQLDQLMHYVAALPDNRLAALLALFAQQRPPQVKELITYFEKTDHKDGAILIAALEMDPGLLKGDPAQQKALFSIAGVDATWAQIFAPQQTASRFSQSEQLKLQNDFEFINAIGHLYKIKDNDGTYKSLSYFTNEALKTLLSNGYNDNQPETRLIYIAALREAMYRTIGKMPYSTQMISLLVAYQHPDKNCILGVTTGEGKGIITALSAAMEWARRKNTTVNVSTANLILAQRDQKLFSKFFDFIGIRTAFITATSAKEDYIKGGVNYTDTVNISLYQAKVATAGGSLTIGDDGTHYATSFIGDEIDEALLDNRIRYNLAGHDTLTGNNTNPYAWLYQYVNAFVNSEHLLPTDSANTHVAKLRQFLGAQAKNANQLNQVDKEKNAPTLIADEQLTVWIDAAIEVHKLKQDKDFIIRTEKDANGHEYGMAYLLINHQVNTLARISDGGHQLLQARLEKDNNQSLLPGLDSNTLPFRIDPESCCISSENSKNVVDWHLNHGGRLLGITGTPGSQEEKEELTEKYGAQILHIPTHKPSKRTRKPVKFAFTEENQHTLIAASLSNNQGQPALVFARDALAAKKLFEALSKDSLKIDGRQYRLVTGNEIIDERLYEQSNTITISTPILGRGTDLSPGHAEGLQVIRTFVSRYRDTVQMEGRAGRNGKPGTCEAIYNTQDLAERYQVTLPTVASNNAAEYNGKNARAALVAAVKDIQDRLDHEGRIERRYQQRYGDKTAEIIQAFARTTKTLSDERLDLKDAITTEKIVIIRQLERLWHNIVSDTDPDSELQNPYLHYRNNVLQEDALQPAFETFCEKASALLETALGKFGLTNVTPTPPINDTIVSTADHADEALSARRTVAEQYKQYYAISDETQDVYQQRILFIRALETLSLTEFSGKNTVLLRAGLCKLRNEYIEKTSEEDRSLQDLKQTFCAEALTIFNQHNTKSRFSFDDFHATIMAPLKIGIADLGVDALKASINLALDHYRKTSFWVSFDRRRAEKTARSELATSKTIDAVKVVLEEAHSTSEKDDTETNKHRLCCFKRNVEKSRFRSTLGFFSEALRKSTETTTATPSLPPAAEKKI